MTLADRLNQIITEQKISKAEFAHRLGVTENYIYILTGNSRPEKKETRTLSRMLAKLIALEFGYDEQWILSGDNSGRLLGDMAYVSQRNLDICGDKNITLFSKTNPDVAVAADKALDEGFSINKDAGTIQCPAGELATRAEKRAAKNGNTYINCVFSSVKCKKCPLREQCRVGKSKGHTYSLTQANAQNQERLTFESSDYSAKS